MIGLRNLHLLSLKMLISATTAVTLPVFAVLIETSSALVVSLGAVLRNFNWTGLMRRIDGA
jgi:hypothetical protein